MICYNLVYIWLYCTQENNLMLPYIEKHVGKTSPENGKKDPGKESTSEELKILAKHCPLTPHAVKIHIPTHLQKKKIKKLIGIKP